MEHVLSSPQQEPTLPPSAALSLWLAPGRSLLWPEGPSTCCACSQPQIFLWFSFPFTLWDATSSECKPAVNQTNQKGGLTYNTTCCSQDNCNSPAPRPMPALTLVFLTSLAGLGLWLLH